uniref:Uncharacterized protein n=1 Tax=viral metagenome TaxID=1070528 RepID=A0A6C0AC45_9ZZZZ
MELISQLEFIKDTVNRNQNNMTKEELIKKIDEVIRIIHEYFNHKNKKDSNSNIQTYFDKKEITKKQVKSITVCHL